MSFTELLQHRRSVRVYLDRPVEREKILKCLEAARLAPSAVNMQPWKYVVVDDAETRDSLFKAAFHGIFFNQWAAKVPVFVVVVIDRKGLIPSVIGFVRDSLVSLLDIGIATEQLVLQAEELGLATCWMGGLHERAVKKLLHIPGSRRVAAIIALGYPDKSVVKRKQERHSLDDISSFNAW